MSSFQQITNRSYSIQTVSIRLLYLFVTLIIANGISDIPGVSEVAKYAKLLVLFPSILLLTNASKAIGFIKENKLIILFWILSLFFSLVQFIYASLDIEILMTNITFIFYLYFFYLLIERITIGSINTSDKILVFICKILSKILNINLVIWTLIGLAFNVPIWHQLDNRVGLGLFYNNYIQLGILGLCGSLIYLLLLKYDRKSKTNIFCFFVYLTIVGLSNSRNSQLVLSVSIFFLFFRNIQSLFIRFKWFILTTLSIAIWYLVDIYDFLLNESIQTITTGRSNIWWYVLQYLDNSSIFLGHGIFGLNNEILLTNKMDNYYFNRIDFLYFHNSYLEVFAASGILGLLLFVWYLISGIRKSKNSLLNPLIIGILAGAFFESFLIQPVILITFLFWILFFLNRKINRIGNITRKIT
jgi:O-antigen ligase